MELAQVAARADSPVWLIAGLALRYRDAAGHQATVAAVPDGLRWRCPSGCDSEELARQFARSEPSKPAEAAKAAEPMAAGTKSAPKATGSRVADPARALPAVVDHMPPHNIEAEEAVLGAILLDNAALSTLRGLEPGHFYADRHAAIFAAMLKVRAGGGAIDAITLTDALRASRKLEQIGGPSYLAELALRVPTALHAQHYARIVEEMAFKRQFIDRSRALAELAINGVSAEALVGEAERQLKPLFSAAPGADDPYRERHAVDAYLGWQAMAGEERRYSIDGLVRVGGSAAVSGLMGAGKTTLAMNVARAWALGEEVLGRRAAQTPVMVIASPKEYENWLEVVGAWELRGLIFIAPSLMAHFRGPDETARWFDGEMTSHNCRAFILDTLFDFYGMPTNQSGGDQNRILMNEQAPLLDLVRERRWAGLVLGHQPKSEAKAIDLRDPEEAFGGHTGWLAQHRMRISLRRRARGVNSIVSGQGGYGDRGILEEQLLAFDPSTRLVSLGGDWSSHVGIAALPTVVDALRAKGASMSRAELETATGRGRSWVSAGLKVGLGRGEIEKSGGSKRFSRYRLAGTIEQEELDL